MSTILTTEQLEQAYNDLLSGIPLFAVARKRKWDLTAKELRTQMLVHYTEQQLNDARSQAASSVLANSQLYRMELNLRRLTQLIAVDSLDEFINILQSVIASAQKRKDE